MNPELRELYQSIIIDHGRNPRNFRQIEGYTHTLEGFNPLCGDRIQLYLKVEDNVITDAGFTGNGCAISMASTSLMNEAIKGKTIEEAKAIQQRFQNMLLNKNEPSPEQDVELDKLTVLGGVKEFPARIKCATLAWHTFEHAIRNDKTPISTE